jgi:hypothetical protein
VSVFFALYINVIFMSFYCVEIVDYCEFGVFFAFNDKLTVLTDALLKSMGKGLKEHTCIIKY